MADGMFGSGVGLSDVLTVLQNGVKAIGNLTQAIAKGNLNQIGTSNTAIGGTAGALPSQPVGYFTVVNQTTGQTVRVPFYG